MAICNRFHEWLDFTGFKVQRPTQMDFVLKKKNVVLALLVLSLNRNDKQVREKINVMEADMGRRGGGT